MMDNYFAVIMAGGGGTRLWPLSRQNRPKQMLKLVDNQTLFQLAVNRLAGLFPPERILVVTMEDQASELQNECPQIPWENFVIEPMPRNTASVVGLAAIAVEKRAAQATMAVVTADHVIRNVPAFQGLLLAGHAAAQTGALVTLGIRPTFPATGYGYIQAGSAVAKYDGCETLRVLRFKEKPDLDTAQHFLQQGDHYWNSGMFIWTVESIQAEFTRQMPELYQGLQKISLAWATDRQQDTIQKVWQGLPPVSIDVGIMEKATDVVVLPANELKWNDLGSWDSFFDILDGDEHGNILQGAKFASVDMDNSLIISNQPDRLIATIGIKNMIVVDTGDALLICHLDEAQKIRQLVEHLKQTNQQKYL